MVDEIDALFMFGDDLEAILDVLEEDERIQDDFTAAVNLVSVEDCIFDSNYRQIHSKVFKMFLLTVTTFLYFAFIQPVKIAWNV